MGIDRIGIYAKKYVGQFRYVERTVPRQSVKALNKTCTGVIGIHIRILIVAIGNVVCYIVGIHKTVVAVDGPVNMPCNSPVELIARQLHILSKVAFSHWG